VSISRIDSILLNTLAPVASLFSTRAFHLVRQGQTRGDLAFEADPIVCIMPSPEDNKSDPLEAASNQATIDNETSAQRPASPSWNDIDDTENLELDFDDLTDEAADSKPPASLVESTNVSTAGSTATNYSASTAPVSNTQTAATMQKAASNVASLPDEGGTWQGGQQATPVKPSKDDSYYYSDYDDANGEDYEDED
jgi:hypothetical protein